jgi:hypothetical protein
MKCCICEKEFSNGKKDDNGNWYCSEKCYKEALPRCYVCFKKTEKMYCVTNGKNFCSKECQNLGEPINYALQLIIRHRLDCFEHLPISSRIKSILKEYLTEEELFNDAVTIAKEKKIVSESDIATSIALSIYLPSVGQVEDEDKPSLISGGADLKIYGFKLASIKARVKFAECLLNLIFSYEQIRAIAERIVIDYKQVDSKCKLLQDTKIRLRIQRDNLFKDIAKRAGLSDADISKLIPNPVSESTGFSIPVVPPGRCLVPIGGPALTFGSRVATMSLCIPLSTLLTVGGALYYLFDRKNKLISEGMADAQTVYIEKINKLKARFNPLIIKSNANNRKLDNYIKELKNEILQNEFAIAQYNLDITVLSEIIKLN